MLDDLMRDQFIQVQNWYLFILKTATIFSTQTHKLNLHLPTVAFHDPILTINQKILINLLTVNPQIFIIIIFIRIRRQK